MSPLASSSLVSAGLCLIGLAIGVGIVVQQIVNAQLRTALGSPLWAGLANFAIGLVALAAVLLALRAPAPALPAAGKVPWYAWTGGLLGAGYVLGAILLVPRLGAATVAVVLIVGQLLGSIALDHVGALGLAVHEAGWPRLLGAALLIAGAVLIAAF